MDKTVLVTGAATGLGRETALYLAERGFAVYGTVLHEDDRTRLDEAVRARGVQVKVLQLDITDSDSVTRAISAVIRDTGSIYGVVNNAGIGLRGYFEDLSEDEIRRVFDANVFGTMRVTRAALQYMRPARKGRIIIITSVGGKIGSLAVSAYCATKFAQEGFAESLAQEVMPFGVRVSIVEPAIIRTERWDVNRGIAAGATNPESPYYAWFMQSEHMANRLVDSSPTKPRDVAKTICRALTAPRPRLRYLVGSRAKLVFALRRYIPGELFDRIYFGWFVRSVTTARTR